MTRIRALLPALAIGAALVAPPAVGAADRRPPRGGGHPGYRPSHHDDRYRPAPPRYRHDYRGHPHRQYRAPRHHYYGPRHCAPRYRYYDPRPYYRPWPAPHYVPVHPVPVYPRPYGGYYPPPPYRGGVHGGVHLGVPGFGLSLYF